MPRSNGASEDVDLHPLAFARAQAAADRSLRRPARRTSARSPGDSIPSLPETTRFPLSYDLDDDPEADRPQPDEPVGALATAPPNAPVCCTCRAAARGPLLYTATQAGELLTIPATWLERAAADGKIPATYVGKYLRFCDADLDEIITAARRRAR